MKPTDHTVNSIAHVRQIASGFQQSRILLTAFELDLFTIIDNRSLTSAQIAEKAGTHHRATDRILNALVAFELLEKTGELFSNTNEAKQLLVKDSPYYLAGLSHSVHLWDTWSSLTKVVQDGTTAHEEHINNRSPEWLQAFISAMHDRGKLQAPQIVSVLQLDKVERILDIGGGSGVFSMAFLEAAAENAHAVILDLPNVVPISQQFIDKEGYTEKFSTIAADYHTAELGSGYDLIFLSAIVHINSYSTNKQLIKRCAAALNPGGQIVIQDWIMNNDRTLPHQGAVFAINMLVGTADGDTYTAAEIMEWFKAAGITQHQFIETPFSVALAIGYK